MIFYFFLFTQAALFNVCCAVMPLPSTFSPNSGKFSTKLKLHNQIGPIAHTVDVSVDLSDFLQPVF